MIRSQLYSLLMLAGLLSLGTAGSAKAALLPIQLMGNVSTVAGDPFHMGLRGGEPFFGLFTYDTAVPPAYDRTDQTIYFQSTSYSVTVAGHQFKPVANDWFVFMSNDTFGDFFTFSAGSDPAGYGTIAIDGVPNPNAGFQIGAVDTTASIFNSVALPVSPFPPLSAFDPRDVTFFSDNTDGPRAASFNVTLTGLQEVPEPSAMALIGLAFAGITAFVLLWPTNRATKRCD